MVRSLRDRQLAHFVAETAVSGAQQLAVRNSLALALSDVEAALTAPRSRGLAVISMNRSLRQTEMDSSLADLTLQMLRADSETLSNLPRSLSQNCS